jgi:hypothetical protein
MAFGDSWGLDLLDLDPLVADLASLRLQAR